MSEKFTGRVLFANGLAAPGVQVRIFDKDAPGKVDDDLTEIPGLSDSHGHFTVQFNLGKYQDYNTFTRIELFGLNIDWSSLSRNIRLPDLSDEYLPYLQFRYIYDGQEQVITEALGPFQSEFRLPHHPSLNYRPSVHGFKFVNSFPGYPLPFSVPALPGAGQVSPAYGLCGGMSSASADFLLASREIPATTKAPRSGTRLHRYLYRRAIDTFGSFGESLLKVAAWMRLPRGGLSGIERRTMDEFGRIRARLDANELVVIALIYTVADSLAEIFKEIWNNHQVLAHAWSQVSPEAIELHVYDPNYPLRDDVRIRVERVLLGETQDPQGQTVPVFGLRAAQWVADQLVRPVYGFFPMPYVPIEPPPGLS